MSGGRVELGLGAGWFEAEHTAYGIPFPASGERFARLAEQLEIITGLWAAPAGQTYSFSGEYYTLTDSPAQDPGDHRRQGPAADPGPGRPVR
jgi:alkanesulfonate monooxygenase SsuD/methylene tetrahydromethanopterin reductase-like flavin-dependent oxidoreductase (luciferase family)